MRLYDCRFFFFSSRRRHTRWTGDWSSDVCSSDLLPFLSSWRDWFPWGAGHGPLGRLRNSPAVWTRYQGGRAGSESPRRLRGPCQIGRASCRERVEISVVAGAFEEKTGEGLGVGVA